MARMLILFVILVLIIIAFTLGQNAEKGRLINLEPDEAESEKWKAKTREATGSNGPTQGNRKGTRVRVDDDVIDVKVIHSDDPVGEPIDVKPEDIEYL